MRGQYIQSIEQIPPMRPIVLLYPTTKLSGFFHFSAAKWWVQKYRPPAVGMADAISACR
jgi:hypothetical protein